MKSQKNPYLSIVVASRNDNHGGDLLKRMQIFVTGLLEQSRRHKLDAELIIVEWNPTPDTPRLAEVMKWPDQPGPCSVRIIEVPPEIHKRYKYSDKLPLFQMIAKNVGIRRARGQFILVTNIDLLFSDKLMHFLARRKLASDSMYRIDRYDVSSEVPMDVPITEILNYCRNNIIRVNTQKGTIVLKDVWGASRGAVWLQDKIDRLRPWFPTLDQLRNLYHPHMLLRGIAHVIRAVACFFKWSLSLQDKINRVRPWFPTLDQLKSLNHPHMLFRGISHVARAVFYFFKWSLLSLWECATLCGSFFQAKKADNRNPWRKLHTNACGDFTLMSKERWFRLRGYPEWEMFSFHLDSILCYMAFFDSVREVILRPSIRAYHIEHTSGWTPEQGRELYRRMHEIGVPIMTNDDVKSYMLKMRKAIRIEPFNKPNWGLTDEELLETCIH